MIVLKEEKKFKFDHYFVFSCLLFSKKNPLKFYYNIISLPWALTFSYLSIFFTSTAKPIGPR